MFTTCTRAARCVALFFVIASASTADTLYFANTHLFRLEAGDQLLTQVGPIGHPISAIAGRRDGRLVGADDLNDRLIVIDAETGRGTPIGAFGDDLTINDLAFDESGRLWAIGCAATPDCPLQLLELDSDTGALIDFGPAIDHVPLTTLTVGNGTFYVGGPSLNFGVLDPVSGAVTDVRPEIDCFAARGAATASDGTLWVSFSNPCGPNLAFLFTLLANLDPLNGEIVQFGPEVAFQGVGPAIVPPARTIEVETPVRANQPVTIDVSYPREFCFDAADVTVSDGRIDLFAREICGCLGGPGPGEFQVTVGPLPVGDVTVALTRQGFDGSGGTCNEPALIAARTITVQTELGVTAVATDPPMPFAGDDVELLVTLPCFAIAEVTSIADRLVWLRTAAPPVNIPCVGQDVYRLQLGPLAAGEHTVVLRSPGDPETFEGLGRFNVRDPGRETIILARRFEVAAGWTRFDGSGDAAFGRLIEGSEIGAELSFANPANPELLVKVLDGCAINGHRWFFAGGLTNLGVDLTVTDLEAGEERSYNNGVGDDFAPILDTQAFACE